MSNVSVYVKEKTGYLINLIYDWCGNDTLGFGA